MFQKPFFLLFLFILLACSHALLAQKLLKEGVLIYDITLDPPANQEGIVQYSGTYTITVKNRQMRKDLKISNGFTNVMLFDEAKNAVYVLKDVQGNKYAIQLDAEQINKRKEKYAGATLQETGTGKNVAGMEVKKGTVSYKNGNRTDMQFSRDWKPEIILFDRMPLTDVLPVVFESSTDDGMMMHFRLSSIDVKPVESVHFRIPQEYKMMSNEEYKKISKK